MSTPTWNVGDLIYVNDPMIKRAAWGVYRIDKLNPKNLQSTKLDTGRRFNIPRSAAKPVPEGMPTDGTAPAPAPAVTVVPFEPFKVLDAGVVVTVAGQGWRFHTPTTRYVVLGRSARSDVEAYKLAVLGGDGGRYYPKVPASMLTVVPAGDRA